MRLAALLLALLTTGCICPDCYLNPGCVQEMARHPVYHPDCP